MNKKQFSEIQKELTGKSIKAVIKKVCGEKIGSGLYRDVYVLKSHPNYVVKIERDMSKGMFANAIEWRHYVQNQQWKWFEQWLAPCEFINQTGSVLIQQRVTHKRRKDYPKYIPSMFTDVKLQNFGWIGDRFVCCDYAYIPFTLSKNKMKYAKWFGTLK